MKTSRLNRLKAGGWEISSTENFLLLSDEEAQFIKLKLSLISTVKKSSQSRIAKMKRAMFPFRWT